MDMKQFEEISLLGRIGYAIMCAEAYLTAIHPSRDWRPLFEMLWSICDKGTFWDEWASEILEILPECLFEFPSFEQSDFSHLDEKDYEIMKSLLSDYDSGTDILLEGIRNMEEAYAYTEIDGIGEESLDILEDIVEVLEKAAVPLPDPKAVAFSSFEECGGRGEPFDYHLLSAVL